MSRKRRPWQHAVSLAEATRLASSLVGLEVTNPWRGLGTALFLELGQLRWDYLRKVNGEIVRRKIGRGSVMIQWSWRVERPRSIAFGSFSSERRINNGIARLRGERIRSIEIVGRIPELRIQFETGGAVASFMTEERQPEWTLFLPDCSWLCVDRGRVLHDTQNRVAGRTHQATPKTLA